MLPCYRFSMTTFRGITTSASAAAAAAVWRRQALSPIAIRRVESSMTGGDVGVGVSVGAIRQVWNASYEHEKEASDIVQSIQQLKAQVEKMNVLCGDQQKKVDVQQQISKLKKDYQLVTGEEYVDENYPRASHDTAVRQNHGD